MEVRTYQCDICGKVKGEANHWFKAAKLSPTITLVPWEFQFDMGIKGSGATILHLCGLGCAHKAMEQTLA